MELLDIRKGVSDRLLQRGRWTVGTPCDGSAADRGSPPWLERHSVGGREILRSSSERGSDVVPASPIGNKRQPGKSIRRSQFGPELLGDRELLPKERDRVVDVVLAKRTATEVIQHPSDVRRN